MDDGLGSGKGGSGPFDDAGHGIALWNTIYLGRALEAARRHGDMIPDGLLAHLAPLGWQHINLTGDYL